jgi:hypothetical protein
MLPALAVIAGLPALLALIYRPSYVNYDARYSMLWARDVIHGHTPDYTGAFAPTPHPLQTLLGGLTLIFGDHSAHAMVALTLLSLGALTWLVYRLGAELVSPAAGVLAAVVVASRPPFDRFALIGYQDLGFAMLVALALLLELRRPRRGPAVLAVLALAGLMRPDAWLLSVLYVAYLWRDSSPRTRAGLVAIAAAGPALWIAQDWIVTGSPLHSLHGTKKLAGEVNRRRSAIDVPFRTAWYFKLLLLWPLAVGVPLGLAFAWRHERRRLLLPLSVAAALTAFILLTALVGLSLISRYLVTPAAILAVAYGLGVFGSRELPPGRARQRWRIAGLVALGLSIAWIPAQALQLRNAKRKIDAEAQNYSDLRLAGKAPAVRARFERCGSISTLGHKPVPDLRYWLDGPPGSVRVAEGSARQVAPLLLEPRATKRMWGLYRGTFAKVRPPAGYRPLYRNRSWVVYASPGCRGGALPQRPGGDSQSL